MLTISLKDLLFWGYHGVYDEERILGNRFKVQLQLGQNTDPGKRIDNLDATINYEKVYAIVKQRMDTPTPLLETILYDIARELFHTFSLLDSVSISIEKLKPPIAGLNGSVLVEIETRREAFFKND